MDQNKENYKEVDLSQPLDNSNAKIQEGMPASQSYIHSAYIHSGSPKIIQWLIKYSGGLIKNENQAAYVLIGFIILAIVVSLFLIFGGEKAEIKAPPGRTIIYPSNEPPRLQ